MNPSKICQYHVPGNPRNICGVPLSGRGVSKFCERHREPAGKEQDRDSARQRRTRLSDQGLLGPTQRIEQYYSRTRRRFLLYDITSPLGCQCLTDKALA